MSGFGDIKESIYTILGSMAVVDGYNFDWTTKRRLDTYVKSSTTVNATIHYPVDTPLGEEIREISTNEYRVISRTIEIKSKVKSTATVLKTEDMVDESNEVIDGMIYDLHKAITTTAINSSCLGVLDVVMGSIVKENITSNAAYYPFLLNAEFTIIYKEER